jgi:two-component system, chemotaxis family, protein-glutamate methylesterase/glutaminase
VRGERQLLRLGNSLSGSGKSGIMGKHDIIVMGGSAGGIEAACDVLADLPGDLPASVFLVQHIGSESALAEVLGRCGTIEVATASDGEPIKPGKAYVAPGDQHLMLQSGRVKVSRGPRENRQRPSVDVLFRSAARAYQSRVIAVVLSGTLDDGAAGVFAVKQRGGIVVVQDPDSALFSSMPRNALRAVQADYCVPLAEIGTLLVRLIHKESTMGKKQTVGVRGLKKLSGPGAAPFVCPECSGPLFQDAESPPGQLACLVGHSFAPESLSEAHREALERALLTTMRLLEERKGIHKHLAKHGHNGHQRRHFDECARAAATDVALLRDILERI